jgi:uncharacterized OB-fold protein
LSQQIMPAIEGWFTLGEEPALLGQRCTQCSTVVFPPVATFCRNPSCSSREFSSVAMSRMGTVWSCTDAHYQPPPPFIPTTDPFEPFAIAAVELEAERLVVLGQVATGFGPGDLKVGSSVELVLETLEVRGDTQYVVWKWRPTSEAAGS